MAQFEVTFDASKALKKLDRVPKVMKKASRDIVRETAKVGTQRLKSRLDRGEPLQSRSGKYKKSIVRDRIRQTRSLTEQRVFARNLPYGNIHEFGGTVSAGKNRMLAIPLPAARTKKGKSRFKSPLRETLGAHFGAKNVFSNKTRNGNIIIFRRSGSKIIPLFVLKPSIKIKKRPMWSPVGASLKRFIRAKSNLIINRALRNL